MMQSITVAAIILAAFITSASAGTSITGSAIVFDGDTVSNLRALIDINISRIVSW